jgi:mono/diheme cytochrome c family protein
VWSPLAFSGNISSSVALVVMILNRIFASAVIAAILCMLPIGISGQPAQVRQPPPLSPQRIFEMTCMTCHGNAKVERDFKPAPASPSALRLMPAESVYEALASGTDLRCRRH